MGRKSASEIDENQEPMSEKAEQILKGAMQEFLAHGYAATSMDRVAAAAGVSKATVYSHFQDKEGLFTALVARMAQQKFSVIYAPTLLEGDPVTVLRRMATVAMSRVCCDPEQHAFVRLVMGEADRFPQLAQIFVQYVTKPGVDFLSHYFTDHPELNIPDPEATARIVIGAIVHFAQVQEMLHGAEIMPMESDRIIDALMHLVMRERVIS
ncbi:MAG: TetR/AcrR family transcriptional regulator [Leptolyngbyaceae cyanobacterium bins.59]|nr:TetR/AcrR family transcriptional regulator [Leptolyngbyaceae cyanobacterium bins.59]